MGLFKGISALVRLQVQVDSAICIGDARPRRGLPCAALKRD